VGCQVPAAGVEGIKDRIEYIVWLSEIIEVIDENVVVVDGCFRDFKCKQGVRAAGGDCGTNQKFGIGGCVLIELG